MRSVLLALFIASTIAVIPTAVENCGTARGITFNAATLSQQPAKGADVTIILYGTASDHIELKNVLMKAKWNGADVFQQDNADDNIYDEGDPVTFSLTSNFPTYTPSGKITVQFIFQDTDKQQVGCGEIKFTL